MSYCYRLQADLLRLGRFVLFRFTCMNAPRAHVKIISIWLDSIGKALFSLIEFQFLRDFKLNKGLYRSIELGVSVLNTKHFSDAALLT